ncbi:MAG: nucleotidyltransferase domain-containing protein [Candidatus Krumholzibacteria bacterium]|nr:nucleotidyltransferase domain-containing protein [Candidatus Krumholzibacteria bacterium]
MSGSPDNNNLAGGSDNQVPEWRQLIEKMRKTRGNQFLRVSRKMLNHLCSIGLSRAQQMLAEVDGAIDLPDISSSGGANVPGARVRLEDSPLMSCGPFELAAEFLGDDEITERVHKWIMEDKASFFSTVVGDPRRTMPEIADAIRRYNDVLRGRSGLTMSTLKSLRVSLIQRFLTEQLDYINVAKEVVRITDFHELLDQMIMTDESHGKMGGKAAGLLLAHWILGQPEADDRGIAKVKMPRTWSIISDAIMDFIKLNELDDVMDQKFKEISQVRREYPNMIQLFKNSTFPPEVTEGLGKALDFFGETPLIIRSSSLLEDRFGTAFSGKYKSLFLANQGDREQRLDALQDAVAEVWASILGPDPIEYRRERGLTEFVEEMGILIQEVVGKRVGRWWLPAFAGVAFSLNEFRWSPRINREDGLIRMVPGLGTRAVDRVGDDFPILAVPGQPGLRASVSVDEVLRYSPQSADVINLETNRFETVKLKDLLHEAGTDFPLVDKIFSVHRDGMLQKTSRFMMDPQADDLVADMEGLLTDTELIPKLHLLMTTLAQYLGNPVDIEFAHDGEDFYLLQCRPQAMTGDAAPAPIPRDIDADRVIFSARKFISNGWVPDISHIVYVVPEEYGKLATPEKMKRVGRAVGLLNRLLPKRKFILMGPGRWGSRGDIKLGVNVTYADINNTAMLIEVARRKGNYVPDLSFGTHFFQDLVEAHIRYLPLYPDESDVVFHEDFLLGSDNLLCELAPDFADLADCIRVIDVPAISGGQVLRVHMNADLEEAVAVLDEADDDGPMKAGAVPAAEHQPRQFWRWRFRMAERMVRSMDAARFGVEAVYLYGSVKNGTAEPESDIDLLVHFRGNAKQHELLDEWFRGWSQALQEMNFSRTGIRVEEMLDITYLSDDEVASGKGLAAKINAVTDAARMLQLS